MSSLKKPTSIQDILEQRQHSVFVGRTEKITLFHKNLLLAPAEQYFLFNVWGQGGVGKSTLLQQFRQIAENTGFSTTSTDETESDVPEVMGRLAKQLEEKGHKLNRFSARYTVYQQKKKELEADPEAPQGLSAFVARTFTKVGLDFVKQVPGGGVVTSIFDEEALANQASEWASYVAKKLNNKDDVQLVTKPIEVLTPLFLQDLYDATARTKLVLFFDTYELTSNFLDEWFRAILNRRYGDLPINLIFVIAGREELDLDRWASYESLLIRLPLEPFTEDEAKQYLTRKGITHPQIINVILQLSDKLPLLLATLAAKSPDAPHKVGDPSGTAVERFLKWIDDPKRRQAALNAAIPKLLNQDVVAVLQEGEASELFGWLKTMPFLDKRSDGWAYHDIVRSQMLRYNKHVAPKTFSDSHAKLATYYNKLKEEIELNEHAKWRNTTWQNLSLNALYHLLCQSPDRHLSNALNDFVAALNLTLYEERRFVREWAETIAKAGKDAESSDTENWGNSLVSGLDAYLAKNYALALKMFEDLVTKGKLQPKWLSVALDWRSLMYKLTKNYQEAIRDFDWSININPNNFWTFENRGDTYYLLGSYETALRDLNQAVSLNSASARIFELRGDVYRAMGRYLDAINDFSKAIQLNPISDLAISKRGDSHRMLGDYLTAIKDFNIAIKLNPENFFAISSRGDTHRQIGDYSAALVDLERAIELYPSSFSALGSRGKVYRLMELYDEALRDFNHSIELKPDNAWALGRRGEALYAIGKYEEALNDLDHSIKLNPQDDYPLAIRGNLYRILGDFEAALTDLNLAISCNPKSALGFGNRGILYHSINQYQEAIKDFQKASQLQDGCTWVYERGKAHLLNGEKEEAMTAFNQAVELNSLCKCALLERGELYRMAGNFKEAINDLSVVLQISPGNIAALGSRGEAYRQTGQFEEALVDLDKAIELNQNYIFALSSRGEALRQMGRYTDALNDFNSALNLDKRYFFALINRGLTHLLILQYQNAILDFNQAIEIKPDNAIAIAYRGQASLFLGQEEEFYKDFDRAIQLEPDNLLIVSLWFSSLSQLVLRGDYCKVLNILDKTLVSEDIIEDSNAFLLFFRGSINLLKKDFSEALQDFERAIGYDSNEAQYFFGRALALLASQQFDKAKVDIDKAVSILQEKNQKNPQDHAAMFGLALFHLVAEDVEKARYFYRKALSDAPLSAVETAIQEIEYFLRVFPDNKLANQARNILVKKLNTQNFGKKPSNIVPEADGVNR